MSAFLISVVSFIVAVSLIVTIHEFGHYIVARGLGVKVLRFSVGFGNPIWTYVSARSGIEYVVAAIPLGGYVKMLDEREADVSPEERDLAFNRKNVYARFAIVAAGPIFNFIFAIAAYLMMFSVGVQGFKPEVGSVVTNSPAYVAGITAGDEIIQVNEYPVATWEDTSLKIIDEALNTGIVNIHTRNANDIVSVSALDLTDTAALLDEGSLLEKLGIEPWRPTLEPILGQLSEEGAAKAQGMQKGDRILEANGEPVADWSQWVEIVQDHPGKIIALRVLRDGSEFQMNLTPKAIDQDGKQIGRIGAPPLVDQDKFDAHRVTLRYGIFESFVKGL